MALKAVSQPMNFTAPQSFLALPGSIGSFLVPLRVGLPMKWVSRFEAHNIRCARVGGVEIPNKKRIETSLQYIHGVGLTTARQILFDVGLENKITAELSEADLTRIREELANYKIEGDLRRFNTLNIRRLIDIQCYRGKRHLAGLPCRGQHTQCNARTQKRARLGKKRPVAGKKKTRK